MCKQESDGILKRNGGLKKLSQSWEIRKMAQFLSFGVGIDQNLTSREVLGRS